MNSSKKLVGLLFIALLFCIAISTMMFWAGRLHERALNEQRGQFNKNCIPETKYVIVGDTIRFKK